MKKNNISQNQKLSCRNKKELETEEKHLRNEEKLEETQTKQMQQINDKKDRN